MIVTCSHRGRAVARVRRIVSSAHAIGVSNRYDPLPSARSALHLVEERRARNESIGLLELQTLWPFPYLPLEEMSRLVRHFLVFEMNSGQMVEDVQVGVKGQAEVNFYGRPGGVIPTPEDVAHQITHHYYKAHLDRDDTPKVLGMGGAS